MRINVQNEPTYSQGYKEEEEEEVVSSEEVVHLSSGGMCVIMYII